MVGSEELELEESELEPLEPLDWESEQDGEQERERASIPAPPRASVPPPLPDAARRTERTGARSGTWRVSVEPPPPPRPQSQPPSVPPQGTAAQRLLELERRAREDRAQVARLRLRNQMQSDQIAALEAELTAARARIAELEQTVAQRPPDDLTRLRGVGPAFARSLQALGVDSFADIAAWDEPRLTEMASFLGIPVSRVRPWVEQARALKG